MLVILINPHLYIHLNYLQVIDWTSECREDGHGFSHKNLVPMVNSELNESLRVLQPLR